MSLKKEQLGASSSFARAGQARSVRRQLTDAAFGVGDPSTLPLDQISFNPDNPRESLGDVSGMASTLQEVGQIQAITVASVEAYLRDRPERASELDPGAEYVVVDGHRRLAGAREAGLASIKVTVDDARVSTDESLLEAAFVANAQRENLSDLEEAQALKTLVAFYGSQHKAAKRLGVTQPYISQRLSLLELQPDLQADLQAGRRKVEHVRGLGKLSPEEQREAADSRAQQAEEKKKQRRTARTNPSTDNGVITGQAKDAPSDHGAQGDNAVITRQGSADASDEVGASDNDVITIANGNPTAKAHPSGNDAATPKPNSPRSEELPNPRAEQSHPTGRLDDVPWADPEAVMNLVLERMAPQDLKRLVFLILNRNESQKKTNSTA